MVVRKRRKQEVVGSWLGCRREQYRTLSNCTNRIIVMKVGQEVEALRDLHPTVKAGARGVIMAVREPRDNDYKTGLNKNRFHCPFNWKYIVSFNKSVRISVTRMEVKRYEESE